MSEIRTIPGVEVKSVNHIHLTWEGEHRFLAGRPGGEVQRIDSSAVFGPSPVDTLLNALASCTAVDVVDILIKRRTPPRALTVDVKGARAAATPARLVGIHLIYRIAGDGVERVHAERAIELAVTKYCSVRDSLDPAIPITWTLELEP